MTHRGWAGCATSSSCLVPVSLINALEPFCWCRPCGCKDGTQGCHGDTQSHAPCQLLSCETECVPVTWLTPGNVSQRTSLNVYVSVPPPQSLSPTFSASLEGPGGRGRLPLKQLFWHQQPLPWLTRTFIADVSNHSRKAGICFALISEEVQPLSRIVRLWNFKGREETAPATIPLCSLPVICGVASAPGVRE